MMRAVLFFLLIATSTTLHAQRPEGSSALKSIVFDADPRSFQVVRVPIPTELRGAPNLTYEIQPQAAFIVIGPRRGTLSGAAAEADLLITLRVPADASAGAHMVAHAMFRAGSNEIQIPIETRIRSARRVALRIESQVEGVQGGDRVDLHATIANMGNAPDTVRLAVEMPKPWNIALRDTTLVLAQGEVAKKLIRFTVPKSSGTGSFFVRTNAVSRGGTASELTTLSVGGRTANMAPPGPTMRMALGGVSVQDGTSAGIAQLAVSGPATTGISVDGRIALHTATGTSTIRGLSRVGAYVTEPHLAAWSGTWRVGLGSTVSNFNDVLGVNAGGRGAGLEYDDQKNILNVTAARQIDTGLGRSGSILGAEYTRRIGAASLGGGISRLRGTGFGDQALSAASVKASASPSSKLLVEGALAYREFATGTGLGWIAGIAGALPRTRAQVRVVHAAGGTHAFARAENELAASAHTTLHERLQVVSSYFRTSDTDIGANRTRSHVYSIVPVYRMGSRAAMRGEFRQTRFEVDGNPFSFANGELHFGAGASVTLGGINYSTDAGVDRLSRGIRTNDVDAEDTGARLTWRATASRSLPFGVLQLEGSYERNDRSTGFVPHQAAFIARADHAQIPYGPRNLFLDAEIGYTYWSGLQSFASLRAGATYMLQAATEISVNVERDPMLYTSGDRTPVVFAIRVERSLGLPRMVTGRAAGVVFQDYNANGRQDADEPGMPNIAVRRGDARATTDREGRYRFWEQARGATVIDIATLPMGWIVSTESQDGYIALLPTTRVEVTLQPGIAERMRMLDLTMIAVTARDAQGRTWVARRTSPEVAVFEALPAGNYEIGIDASALAEPMRVDGTPPRVNVTRETMTRITLPIAGRPLRFKQNP